MLGESLFWAKRPRKPSSIKVLIYCRSEERGVETETEEEEEEVESGESSGSSGVFKSDFQ